MNEIELRREIRELLIETLMLTVPAGEPADEQPLFGPGGAGLDSVDALQLVVALDKHYGLKVTDAEVARQVLANVGSMAEAVYGTEPKRARTTRSLNPRHHPRSGRTFPDGFLSGTLRGFCCLFKFES